MPLFAKLKIIRPDAPQTRFATVTERHGGGTREREFAITLPPGFYSAELDCGLGRVVRVPGAWESDAAARHAAVMFAARRLGRAVLAE